MIFNQHYLGCLAHASYFIASGNEAVVIDPQRDVDEYLEEARRHGCTIRYILETHLHADFVSGHCELAARTGAEIVYGKRADAAFDHIAVTDGDELRIGRVVLRAMETPGHTPEGISWLVIDEEQGPEPLKVLTGDTLFIGDVGRPDLAGAKGHTAEEMAGSLYQSLHEKLLRLDDAVEVWPAHGAGSACGKNISRERSSTIGMQRRTNHALQPMTREDFICMMTAGLEQPPVYFGMDAEMNRMGPRSLTELTVPMLSPEQAAGAIASGAVLLDVRDSESFASGHVPGSINIGLSGQFASWSGSLLNPHQPIVIVSANEAGGREAAMRLARVGLENVSGILAGGVENWTREGRTSATTIHWSVGQLHEEQAIHVIDVRRAGEYQSGHVPGADNIPLSELGTAIDALPRDRALAIICASGYRSSAAASLLAREGFTNVRNVTGGTAAWLAAGYPAEVAVASS